MISEIPKFAFVVDTEEYAGFYSDLCVYVTGALGVSSYSAEEEAFYRSEMKNIFDDVITQNPEGNPAMPWPTPGWFNDGTDEGVRAGDVGQKTGLEPAEFSVAIFFHRCPSKRMLNILKRRSRAFCKRRRITLSGFRLLKLELKETELPLT